MTYPLLEVCTMPNTRREHPTPDPMPAATLTVPADPKRVLIPLSLVMASVFAVGGVMWKGTVAVTQMQTAVEQNTKAVEELNHKLIRETLTRSEFSIFQARLKDLNPELKLPN